MQLKIQMFDILTSYLQFYTSNPLLNFWATFSASKHSTKRTNLIKQIKCFVVKDSFKGREVTNKTKNRRTWKEAFWAFSFLFFVTWVQSKDFLMTKNFQIFFTAELCNLELDFFSAAIFWWKKAPILSEIGIC